MAAKKKKKASKKKSPARAAKAKTSPARKAKKTAKKTVKKPAKKASKKSAKRAAKPAARKPAKKAAKPATRKKQIVGEGDYQASRTFLKDQSNFVKKNKSSIPAMGREASRALEGPEGDALRQAETEAASHSRDNLT
ncbi:MAG: hypothetical protein V4601_08215 [Pseudomonadota bacterium]